MSSIGFDENLFPSYNLFILGRVNEKYYTKTYSVLFTYQNQSYIIYKAEKSITALLNEVK